MKRYLNLNAHSGKIILLIAVLVGAIPAALFLLARLLEALALPHGALTTVGQISLRAGGGIFFLFGLLLIAEQIQDAWLDRRYRKNRKQRVQLADGFYECQYCGYQKVQASARSCTMCGRELE